MLTLAVFISGNGSNLQAIIDAIARGELRARIACVISNRNDAYGLTRAQLAGIPTVIFSKHEIAYQTQDPADQAELIDNAIAAYLRPLKIDLCVLAGYMRIITPALIAQYPGRILNIHPSLLPAYPGLHTHARALADGQPQHGCTVHIVTAELDAGPILAQAALSVDPEDTVASLSQRVHRLEHTLYVTTLQRIAQHPAVLHNTAELTALFHCERAISRL